MSTQLLAAVEEVEFDGEGDAGDGAAELLDQLHGRAHGAAGGEQVVYEKDALAGLDGVLVNLERVGAVLEVVADLLDDLGAGSFFGLRTRERSRR